MNDSIYQARMALFKTLDLPVSQADVRRLRRRQAIKLGVWELGLRSLFILKRLIDILGGIVGLILLTPLFMVVGIAIMLEDGWPIFLTETGGAIRPPVQFLQVSIHVPQCRPNEGRVDSG